MYTALPQNEASRLAELHSYHVLYTGPSPAFDHIVALAAQLCSLPYAVINLIDRDRHWFKAVHGLEGYRELPRDMGFCSWVIAEHAYVEVNDLAQDMRFSSHPLVAGAPRFRFYAGMPLVTGNGQILGTLVLLDTAPRTLSEAQRNALGHLADVTLALLDAERKAYLQQQHEQHLRVIQDNSRAASILVDAQGTVLEWNRRAERLFGWRAEEMRGQPLDDSLVPARAKAAFKKCLQRLPAHPMRFRRGIAATACRCDGAEIPVELNVTPWQSETGWRYIAVLQDLSAQKHMTARLVASEQAFRALAENTPDIILRVDRQRRIRYVNAAMTGLTGLPADALLGQPVDSLAGHWGIELPLAVAVDKVFGSGCEVDQEYDVQLATETRFFQARLVPERAPHGEVCSVLGILRDETRLKRAEEEVHESQQLLRDLAAHRETVREDEKKRIAREVHDELGQLLMALKMGASFLGIQMAGAGPQAQIKIREMKELIDQCTGTVRHIAANLRPVVLDWGVLSALAWLAEDFSRHYGIPCAFHCDEQEPALHDEQANAIFRIVQESLTNVARHAGASQVDISLWRHKQSLYIMTTDDGKGMDPDQSKRGSFGLLGIKERAALLGGKVEIFSSLENGTSITLIIPSA